MPFTRSIFCLLPLLLACMYSLAQEDNNTFHSDSVQLGIKAYSSMRGQLAIYDNEMEVQGNASRIGFESELSKGGARYFFYVELAVTLLQQGIVFNAGQTTQSGFLDAEISSEPIFGTRLAYGGVDLGAWGTLSLGKQWGVYYDITGYTDKFTVFGGRGSATFVANSDGGTTGTGRANQSLVYRNRFGPLKVGGLIQLLNTESKNLIDAVGFSGQLQLPLGFSLGGAINTFFVSDSVASNVAGLEDDPFYWTLGGYYKSENLYFAVVYANQRDGDLIQIISNDEPLDVIFNATGFELFAKYDFEKLSLLGGYNYYSPGSGDSFLQIDFKRRDYIFGLEYHVWPFMLLYLEGRLAEGTNDALIQDYDVLTLGLKLDLDKSWVKNFHL